MMQGCGPARFGCCDRCVLVGKRRDCCRGGQEQCWVKEGCVPWSRMSGTLRRTKSHHRTDHILKAQGAAKERSQSPSQNMLENLIQHREDQLHWVFLREQFWMLGFFVFVLVIPPRLRVLRVLREKGCWLFLRGSPCLREKGIWFLAPADKGRLLRRPGGTDSRRLAVVWKT